MVTFLINEKVLEFNETDTILEVKKEIIKQLELTCKYIDLVFILEKPMRILGKFNVEPGKLARTLDRYVLEKFAFKDSIKLDYEEVEGYDPDKRVPIISGGRGRGRSGGFTYIPPNRNESTFDHDSLQQKMDLEPTFNLDSNDDFPSLQ
jgi:hypothetical protein